MESHLIMGIKKSIGKLGLKLGGWKTVNEAPKDLGNAVCIMAPHTAIEDFFVGLAYYWYYGIKFKVMIKQEFFKPGISWLLKKVGIRITSWNRWLRCSAKTKTHNS